MVYKERRRWQSEFVKSLHTWEIPKGASLLTRVNKSKKISKVI